MTIPVFRHNQAHDDWEVASVYFSDDCSNFGRSVCDEPVRSAGSFDDPALRSRGPLYDGTRPHVRYSVPQQQPQNYPLVARARPQWDTRYVPGKQSNFVVPPPGVIFPSKERLPLPQDTYWPRPPGQIASSSDRLLDATLAEPPPPSLLLSPSSPPHASASLVKLPIPQATIGPHGTTVAKSGTGPNVNGHASPLMGPPPRYHEVAPSNPPRLMEAGCHQAHSGSGMSPRRSGHDVYAGMLRGGPPSEEMAAMEGRTVFGGSGNYGPGERPELHERQEYAGRGRTVGRAETRERRPSLWRQLVRRFGPSRGQT